MATIEFETKLGVFETEDWDSMRLLLKSRPTDPGYEPDVEAALREHVRPGMRVLNVGANIGYFTRLMYDLVTAEGAPGTVVAVEPDPTNFGHLLANVPAAVTCHQVAALDEEGLVDLWRPFPNSGDQRVFGLPVEGEHVHVQVGATRLEYLVGDIDFALFDCQGVDHRAVMGLRDKLPAVVVVEHWPDGIRWSGHDPDTVIDLYRSLGYSVRSLNGRDEGDRNLLLTRSE